MFETRGGFDEAALAPAYRLLWGSGRSRALQIAERFGMDEAVTRDARRALGEGRVTLETTISALETARRGADENISSARALLQEVRRTVPKIRRAAARVEAAEEKSDAEVAAGVSSRDSPRGARGAGRVGAAARSRRESTLANGADFASAAAKPPPPRGGERLDALAAAPKPAVPPGWAPEAGERVVVKSTGMRGEVASTTGGKLVVRAGAMQIKVSAADVEPDSEAEAPARPNAKARSPRGTRAAARVDALLAGRGPGARGGAGNAPPPPPPTRSGSGSSSTTPRTTIGDGVRIRKTGVVGTVVGPSACPGRRGGTSSSPRSGRGAAPRRRARAGRGRGLGGGGKKKQKKKGGGLPRATQTQRGGGGRNAGPSDASGGSDVNDLMAKFNRR